MTDTAPQPPAAATLLATTPGGPTPAAPAAGDAAAAPAPAPSLVPPLTGAAQAPKPALPGFAKGSLVVRRHTDPYRGVTVSRWGIVVAELPGEDAKPGRSVVAWLDGPSDPIGNDELEVG